MMVRELIRQSEELLVEKDYPYLDFQKGAEWMAFQIDEPFKEGTNYQLYGYFKYGISLFGMGLSIFYLWQIHWLLLPLAILVFYFLEVQFAFLFLLLIDQVKQPLATSIRISNQFGIWKLMTIILPLGVYMMVGLLDAKKPYRNWYVGCLSVVLLYQHEIRNRQ